MDTDEIGKDVLFIPFALRDPVRIVLRRTRHHLHFLQPHELQCAGTGAVYRLAKLYQPVFSGRYFPDCH